MNELNLRAFDDAVAEAAEDVLDLAPRGAEQMVVACGFKRRAGQRDVNVVFGKCGAHHKVQNHCAVLANRLTLGYKM